MRRATEFGLDPIETRALPRWIAALPDIVFAACLAYVWFAPLVVGREGVVSAVAIITLELPLLGALWGGIALTSPFGDIRQKTMGCAALGVCLSIAAVLAAQSYGRAPGTYLLSTLAFAFVGKLLVFHSGRPNAPFFEGTKVVLHLFGLLAMLGIARSGTLPELGFAGDAAAQLGLPRTIKLDGSAPTHYDRGQTLYSFIAGGAGYFLVCALIRFFLSTRPLRRDSH